VHYRLGRIYLTRFKEGQKPEDRDAAVREFTAERDIDPSNGNAGYELANMQAELGNLEDARKGYEDVLELFPNFEEALVGLGGVYTDSHKPEQAIPILEHATRLNPDDEVAWYRLARAKRATGDREGQQKALAVFEKLHSAKPLHKPVTDEEATPQKLDREAQP
jgi:tetratricopeptide (TPR) repeat protein